MSRCPWISRTARPPRSSQATSTWTILCSPARTPTLGPCSTRPWKQFPRKASALPQRPRTRTCALRGGTKGTAEPALLRMTWRETPRPAPWPATGRGRPPSRTACAAMSGAGGVAEDVRSFFRAVFLVRCRLLSGRELGSVGAAQGPVCPRLFFFFFHACQEWDGCGGSAGWDVGWGGGGWEDGRGFFFGRGSLFFPCPPGGGLGGEPQARSSSFAFFFLGFCVARGGPPPSKRRREAEFNSAKARFFPFVFPFFSARLAGPGAR